MMVLMGRLEFANDAVAGWAQLRQSEDLQGLSVIQKLVWTGRVAETLLERAAVSTGLRRRGDYEVLALLRRTEPEPMTPAELAEQLVTSPSGMTGKLDRLERQGLLLREPDPDDRRGLRLRLTESGRSFVDNTFDRMLLLYRRMLGDMSKDDSTNLENHLSQLLENLESLERLNDPWSHYK